MSDRRRVHKVAERIREVVALVLRGLHDPRFALVTITSVVVSPDLRQAKVYWIPSHSASCEPKKRIKEVQQAFSKAAGKLKHEVGVELGVRFVPELKFFHDNTLDTVEDIEKLFGRIHGES